MTYTTESTTTASTTELNKQRIQTAHEESARGNAQPFRELFADDIRWTTIGSTEWSRTYCGKEALLSMFRRLYALLEGRHVVIAHRFIAEGDLVVVEARSQSTTKTGKPYRNTYCLVYRLENGKIVEGTEYCDTALIEAAL